MSLLSKCCARSIRTLRRITTYHEKTPIMPSFQFIYQTVTLAGNEYKIRSLLDLQPFSDPAVDTRRMGISSAGWPPFRRIRPSALVLAGPCVIAIRRANAFRKLKADRRCPVRGDPIIGGGVLYAPCRPGLPARVIGQHSAQDAQVIIEAFDRGNRSAFCREMRALGYQSRWRRANRRLENGVPDNSRLPIFYRLATEAAA